MQQRGSRGGRRVCSRCRLHQEGAGEWCVKYLEARTCLGEQWPEVEHICPAASWHHQPSLVQGCFCIQSTQHPQKYKVTEGDTCDLTTRGHEQDAPRPWCRKSKSALLSTFPSSCTDPNLGVPLRAVSTRFFWTVVQWQTSMARIAALQVSNAWWQQRSTPPQTVGAQPLLGLPGKNSRAYSALPTYCVALSASGQIHESVP